MDFSLGDIVLFNNQIGQVDGLELDATNNNKIVGVEVGFTRKYSGYNGRLTFTESTLNELKLHRKRKGNYPHYKMDYVKHMDNENIYSKVE